MIVTTWNVNGLRAALNKGFMDSAGLLDADVLCLQEIKANPEQIPEVLHNFDKYSVTWNSAKRPGYSGVAIFTRIAPQEVRLGIGIDSFDVEGRVIRMKFDDFYLYNVYFPSGQSGPERVAYKLAFYEALLNDCKILMDRGENVVITGDYNTAHNEIDLANPKTNQRTSGFLPEERAWVSKYLANGLKDAFRELYPEKIQYTWWSQRTRARERNIGWRLDYFLVNDAFFPRVENVTIYNDIFGSDHCPVSIVIR